MMANNAIRPSSYAALAAKILEETLVLPKLGVREFQNPTDSFKVWVAGDESMVDYTPGTALTGTDPNGDYVTINDPKDKAIFKLIDKNQLRKVYNPVEHIDQLVVKSLQAAATQLDKDILTNLAANGTQAVAAAGDALTAATVKAEIAKLEVEMNKAKAPIEGRFLVVDADTAGLLTEAMVLQTSFGDSIQANGFKTIGAVGGFTVLMSLYLPANTNMIAFHRDAFGGNYEQIEDIELIEVPRGNGTIGAWAVDGRVAYNYDILRKTLVQVHKGRA